MSFFIVIGVLGVGLLLVGIIGGIYENQRMKQDGDDSDSESRIAIVREINSHRK